MESLKPDCACAVQRKTQKTWPRGSTRHFLQCNLKARPTELRRFSAILAVMPLDFSAVQTAWRREVDSNLRYNSFRCKWLMFASVTADRVDQRVLPVALSGTLSPVRFQGGNRRIAAISRNFCGNAAEFLCNPDCVAEGSGFEPSVQLVSLQVVNVCVGYSGSGRSESFE